MESLEYIVEYGCCHDHVFTLPNKLKQLKLFYAEDVDGNLIRTSLRQLSELTKLALYDNGSRQFLPNGAIWEMLIQSSLPLLETFQFCFPFHRYDITIDDIEQAVASFSTTFYLFEKRWFIRCDYNCQYYATGTLYSLPFAFAQMPINMTSFDTGLSTLMMNDEDPSEYESYKKVKTLLFMEKCQMPHPGFRTSNIVRLVLNTTLPTSWHFLLNNLRHLELRTSLHISSTDFAHFLTNTPRLHSLTVPIMILSNITDNFSNLVVCDQLSNRIESLTISDYNSVEGRLGHVAIEDLPSLVRIFGKTCKYLALGLVAHPQTVITTLQTMRQLCSLHIYCRLQCHGSRDIATRWLKLMRENSDIADFMYISDDYNFYVWFKDRI